MSKRIDHQKCHEIWGNEGLALSTFSGKAHNNFIKIVNVLKNY